MVNWDEWHANHAPVRAPSEALARFVAETFPDRSGLHAIEIGCGTGANLGFLVECDFLVCGIDGSDKAIEIACRRLLGYGALWIVNGSIAALPWHDGTFDCVIDIEAIYANPWPDIQKIVGEVRRVLTPGGWFFGQMMHEAEDETKPDLSFGHRFTEPELRELFAWADPLVIDQQWRSARGGSAYLGEWLVRARKPA